MLGWGDPTDEQKLQNLLRASLVLALLFFFLKYQDTIQTPKTSWLC